jgi:hypothetical protein
VREMGLDPLEGEENPRGVQTLLRFPVSGEVKIFHRQVLTQGSGGVGSGIR